MIARERATKKRGKIYCSRLFVLFSWPVWASFATVVGLPKTNFYNSVGRILNGHALNLLFVFMLLLYVLYVYQQSITRDTRWRGIYRSRTSIMCIFFLLSCLYLTSGDPGVGSRSDHKKAPPCLGFRCDIQEEEREEWSDGATAIYGSLRGREGARQEKDASWITRSPLVDQLR